MKRVGAFGLVLALILVLLLDPLVRLHAGAVEHEAAVRRQRVEKAVHGGAPGPEAVAPVRAAPLGQAGQADPGQSQGQQQEEEQQHRQHNNNNIINHDNNDNYY